MSCMPAPSTDPALQDTAFARAHLVLCALVVVIMAWNVYAYLGINWELLATKHYFAVRYYGGYADRILLQDGKMFTVQAESWSCLGYVASSLTPRGELYDSGLNVDRIYTCGFLPSLVVRLAAGHVQLGTAIVIVNFLLWIASIALTYAAVAAWSKNRTAALMGAVIAAGYPIYGLMFASWKTQDAGALLLLAWIYVDKAIWPRLGWVERALLLDLTFTATMLASGAAYFIFVYIVAQSLYRIMFDAPARRDASLTLFVTLCAFVVGKLANNVIANHYHLTSALSAYRVDKMLLDSLEYLRVALSGGDTSSLRFMNYPGASFLTSILPWFIALCVRANPLVALVPLVGIFVIRDLRPLLLVIPFLFLVGHAPAIIAGGWTWYYGYSSAPAVQLLIMATAFCLGQLFDSKLAVGRALSAATLLIAVYWFNASPAFNFKNFYSDTYIYLVDRRLYVYHDDELTRYW